VAGREPKGEKSRLAAGMREQVGEGKGGTSAGGLGLVSVHGPAWPRRVGGPSYDLTYMLYAVTEQGTYITCHQSLIPQISSYRTKYATATSCGLYSVL
jgi:hypothetical protein